MATSILSNNVQSGRREFEILASGSSNNTKNSVIDWLVISKYFNELNACFAVIDTALHNCDPQYTIHYKDGECTFDLDKDAAYVGHDYFGTPVSSRSRIQELHGKRFVGEIFPKVLEKLGKRPEQIKNMQAFLNYKLSKNKIHRDESLKINFNSLNHFLKKLQYGTFKTAAEKAKKAGLSSSSTGTPFLSPPPCDSTYGTSSVAHTLIPSSTKSTIPSSSGSFSSDPLPTDKMPAAMKASLPSSTPLTVPSSPASSYEDTLLDHEIPAGTKAASSSSKKSSDSCVSSPSSSNLTAMVSSSSISDVSALLPGYGTSTESTDLPRASSFKSSFSKTYFSASGLISESYVAQSSLSSDKELEDDFEFSDNSFVNTNSSSRNFFQKLYDSVYNFFSWIFSFFS